MTRIERYEVILIETLNRNGHLPEVMILPYIVLWVNMMFNANYTCQEIVILLSRIKPKVYARVGAVINQVIIKLLDNEANQVDFLEQPAIMLAV